MVAQAASFTVTSTSNSGAGSLREAITSANAEAGPHTIQFDIPTDDTGYNPANGTWTIGLHASLPAITSAGVTIDASTQTATRGDRNPDGPEIMVIQSPDFSAGQIDIGLRLTGDSAVLKGLIISGFGNGITIFGSQGSRIEQCYIGTDPTGQNAAVARNGTGISIYNASNTVIGGAPGAGNRIGFNRQAGVTSSAGSTLSNNNDILSNTIFSNGGAGITIHSGTGHNLQGNSIYGNGGLGIDIGAAGVTANDLNDDDLGANNLQNHPFITSVTTDGVNTTLTGNLAYKASDAFTIEFFRNTTGTSADSSGFGEGEVFVSSLPLPAAFGPRTFTHVIPGTYPNETFSATATNIRTGDTSEFGPAVSSASSTVVVNTADSGVGSLRNAINVANYSQSGGITFNIPTSDPGYNAAIGTFTIALQSELPALTRTNITLNGHTQTTYAGNTNPLGPEIVLTTAPGISISKGLHIRTGGTTTTGLIISGFTYGVFLDGAAGVTGANANRGGRLDECYIGTDHTGQAAPVARNTIGVMASSTLTLGFASFTIGTSPTNMSSGNVIAFNLGSGVVLGKGSLLTVRGNRIFSNGGLGIDLGLNSGGTDGNGVTPNDVGDGDSGVNTLQNYPIISSVVVVNGNTSISGTLNSTPNVFASIELFRNTPDSGTDASGYGEGEFSVGMVGATADAAGNAPFSLTIPGTFPGQTFSATATCNSNTSEFSPVRPINAPPSQGDDSAQTLEDVAVTIPVLANDSDAENGAVTLTSVTQGAHGMVTINTDNTLTYTPEANYNGPDNFTYNISDGDLSSTATVTITVTPVNDAPSFTVGIDQTVMEDASQQTVNQWATKINAGPANEKTQSYQFQVTTDNDALFSVKPAVSDFGILIYTPAPQANGVATVTVVLKDNGGTANGGVDTSAIQTFKITVTPASDAPQATVTLSPNPPRTNDMLTATAQGYDPDGDEVTFSYVWKKNGVVMAGQTGTTLNLSVTGNGDKGDQITVEVTPRDGAISGTPATATVTVGNTPPTVTDQAEVTDKNKAHTFELIAVDTDGEPLSFTLKSLPTHGRLYLGSDTRVLMETGSTFAPPRLTYVPHTNYSGPDVFNFAVSDGTTEGNAKLFLTVNPTNGAPQATVVLAPQQPNTNSTLTTTVSSYDVDGDNVTFSYVWKKNGVVLTGQTSASLNLSLAGNGDQGDQITVVVTPHDGTIAGTPATATITVANTPPAVSMHNENISEDTPRTINLHATDIDGTPLTYIVSSLPGNGVLYAGAGVNGHRILAAELPYVLPAPQVTYAPAAEYNGTDVFDVSVSDGSAQSSAKINLTVLAGNDAPIARAGEDRTIALAHGQSQATITLDGTASSDIDSSSLIYEWSENNIIFANGPIVTRQWTAGTHVITLMVNDRNFGLGTDQVVLTVLPAPNAPPVAGNDTAQTDAGQKVTIAVLSNDSDADTDPLTVTSVTQGARGAVTLNADNTVSYTPQAGTSGTDSFTYKLSDGLGGTATGTVTVTVKPLTLTLVVTPETFSETDGIQAATATVSRNGATTASLTVPLSSSNSGSATVPTIVTIPAGATSANFFVAAVDNTVADGTRTSTINAAAAGFVGASKTVTVTDNEVAKLTLSVSPGTVSEAGGANAATATVTRNTTTTAPLTVTLASNDTSEATVQASVTIPAGALFTTFSVAAVDDAVFDGNKTATITASGAGLTGAATNVVVTDNDTAKLTLAFNQSRISETGVTSAQGTVTRNTEVTATTPALTVALTSSPTGQLTTPSTVTIPAGAASANFNVQAVNDKLTDGPRQVTITATASSFAAGSASLVVTDDESGSNLSISGKVTLPAAQGSAPIAGVLFTLRVGSVIYDTATSATDGTYAFSRLPRDTYTITPSKVGYTFSPSATTIKLQQSKTGNNFIGTGG
jgi:VCBS repeat-containing protein